MKKFFFIFICVFLFYKAHAGESPGGVKKESKLNQYGEASLGLGVLSGFVQEEPGFSETVFDFNMAGGRQLLSILSAGANFSFKTSVAGGSGDANNDSGFFYMGIGGEIFLHFPWQSSVAYAGPYLKYGYQIWAAQIPVEYVYRDRLGYSDITKIGILLPSNATKSAGGGIYAELSSTKFDNAEYQSISIGIRETF